jgi:hypothetical protein
MQAQDDPGQGQALACERYKDRGEREKQNAGAMGKRRA